MNAIITAFSGDACRFIEFCLKKGDDGYFVSTLASNFHEMLAFSVLDS